MSDYAPPMFQSADGSMNPLVGLSAYTLKPLSIVAGAITIPGAGLYVVHPETGTADNLDEIIDTCLAGERIILMAYPACSVTLRPSFVNIVTPLEFTNLSLGFSNEGGVEATMGVCELVKRSDGKWHVMGAGSAQGVMATHRTFIETAGAGTYTATIILPAYATVLDFRFSNRALWGATTARLNAGDAADADGYFANVDLTTVPIANVHEAGGISSFQSGFGVGGYTPTNVTPDRSFDANNTSLDEIADVLGTVISDAGTPGAGAYAGLTKFSANGQTITAAIVTTGATGDTGRSRLTVLYSVGEGVSATKT